MKTTITHKGYIVITSKIQGEFKSEVISRVLCKTEDCVIAALFPDDKIRMSILLNPESKCSILNALMPYANGDIMYGQEPWTRKSVKFSFDE